MGLILPVVLLGLMASLSPSTLLVFILLLGTTLARLNAAAFLVGWAISLTLVFTLSYALGSSQSTQQGPGRSSVQVIEILLGLVLLVAGVRAARHRNEPRDDLAGGRSDRYRERLRGLRPWGAGVVGVLKQPWAITAAAAVVVVHHEAPLLVTVIAFACFTVVSTATVGLIFLYYSRSPGEAQAGLARLEERVTAVGPALIAVVALLVGAFLTFDGLLALTGG